MNGSPPMDASRASGSPTPDPTMPLAAKPGRVGSYRALLATMLVAAVFCGVVFTAMVVQHWRTRNEAPLKSPPLAALKEQLRTSPKDEPLKTRIREADLLMRQVYFRHLAFNRAGGWMLLAGLVVVVVAGKQVAQLRRRSYLPQAHDEASETRARMSGRARLLLATIAMLVGGSLLALAFASRTVLPQRPAEMQKLLAKLAGTESDAAADLPAPAEFLANWPRFLGPTGNAFATNNAVPVNVNLATGEGLLWKAGVRGAGFNSPVVWNNRVFLSGGDAAQREVFCFDAATGSNLWQRAIQNLPGSPAKQPEIPESTGFAASTMATDGRRVYAIFGNGDLAAVKFDGSPAWARNIGVPDNPYGHAQSLVPCLGRLLVPLDQGEAEKGKSRLYLLDAATGKPVWERVRPVPNTWATPIVIDAAGKTQIITLGGSWVIAYAAKDGAELWRVECLNGEITPSPIFAGGYVLAISPNERLVAIKPDGQGEVTKTHIAWSYDQNLPDISSPVSNGELVYTVSTPGVLTCIEVKTGQKQWEHDFSFEADASPAIAGSRLCLVSKKGLLVWVEAGRQFRELARVDLGEPVLASPAFANNRMYLRTMKSLFCFGAQGDKLAKQQ